LATNTTVAGGGVYQDTPTSLNTSDGITASAWVKGEGGPASGTFCVWGTGINAAENSCQNFAVDASTYKQVQVVLNPRTAHDNVRVQIYATPNGGTINLDTVTAEIVSKTAVTSAPVVAAPTSVGAAIVATARSYALGAWAGQCRVYAGNVVVAALKSQGRIVSDAGYGAAGGAYWGAFEQMGGTHIALSQVLPGDLIQLNNPSARTSNEYFAGMHTVIVVGLADASHPGQLVVRDSNYGWTEKVAEHWWTPPANGTEANAWRFYHPRKCSQAKQ
jgi:hypothetical protein